MRGGHSRTGSGSSWRQSRLALSVALAASLVLPAAVVAQDASTPGQGSNLAFTLVDVKPPFFRTGPSTISARHPGLYLRRASVSGESDQQLLIASVSDDDVIGPQVAAIGTMDLLEELDGSVTLWGDVAAQTQPLTVAASPDIGFVLGLFAGRDPTLRGESLDAAVTALRGIDGVFLVARLRGGADLLAMYSLDGADLGAAVQTASAIQDAMGAVEIEIEIEGVSIPLAGEGA